MWVYGRIATPAVFEIKRVSSHQIYPEIVSQAQYKIALQYGILSCLYIIVTSRLTKAFIPVEQVKAGEPDLALVIPEQGSVH